MWLKTKWLLFESKLCRRSFKAITHKQLFFVKPVTRNCFTRRTRHRKSDAGKITKQSKRGEKEDWKGQGSTLSRDNWYLSSVQAMSLRGGWRPGGNKITKRVWRYLEGKSSWLVDCSRRCFTGSTSKVLNLFGILGYSLGQKQAGRRADWSMLDIFISSFRCNTLRTRCALLARWKY